MFGDFDEEMDRKKEKPKGQSTREDIRDLVEQCIMTHNEEVLVNLIYYLEKEYIEVARLASYDAYSASWTHEDVLNYLTYHT